MNMLIFFIIFFEMAVLCISPAPMLLNAQTDPRHSDHMGWIRLRPDEHRRA
jgi:hypothetical protein